MQEKEQRAGLRLKKKLSLEGNSEDCLLLDNQKFTHRHVNANAHALSLLKYDLNAEAIIELQNSEKELQDSMKCGRKISDHLIFAVLHNLASLHYKVGSYSKSLDYIRTILHILSSRLSWVSVYPGFQSHMHSLCLTANTAKLYLYFLNLALQLNMLEAGAIPANRALEFLKKFAKDYQQSNIAPILINTQMTTKLLKQIQHFQQIFVSKNILEIMALLQVNLSKLKKQTRKLKANNSTTKDLLNISTVQLSIQNRQVICHALTPIKTFSNGLLEFPTTLFLIGKLNRESANNKFKSKEDSGKRTMALQKSSKYILWGLYFASELSGDINLIIKQMYSYYDEFFYQASEQQLSAKTFAVDSSDRLAKEIIKIWKDIKKLIHPINQQTQFKRYQDSAPILNLNKQHNFQKILLEEKQKHTINLQQKRVESQYFQSDSNTIIPEFKHKDSPRKKSAHEKSQSKISRQEQKECTAHSKTKKKSNQAKSLSLRSSNLSSTKSIKIEKNRNKDKQKTQTQEASDEYFPRPSINRKSKNDEKKTPQKLVANYLSLQKKINESSKNLQKKKKLLAKSLRKY